MSASVFGRTAPLAFRQTKCYGFSPCRIAERRKCSESVQPSHSDPQKSRWHCSATLGFPITLSAGDRRVRSNSKACAPLPREMCHRPRALIFRHRTNPPWCQRDRRLDREPLLVRSGRSMRKTIVRRKPSRSDLAPRPRCRSYVAHNPGSRALKHRARFVTAICRRSFPPRIGFHENENHPRNVARCCRSK